MEEMVVTLVVVFMVILNGLGAIVCMVRRDAAGLILLVLTFFVLLVSFALLSPEEIKYEIENIAITSLGNDSQTETVFNSFLFAQSGTIGSTKYYQVYMTDGEKKKLVEFEATQTEIVEYEEGENSPHIEVTWKMYESVLPDFYGNLFVERDQRFDGYSGFADKNTLGVEKIVIYVPAGTIDESFSVKWNK